LAASHTSPTASIADLALVYPGESITDIPSVASLTAILGALFQVIARQEPEKMNSLKQGLQKNLNWLFEDGEEKKIQDADIMRQF